MSSPEGGQDVVDLLAGGRRLLAAAREAGRDQGVRAVVRQAGQRVVLLGVCVLTVSTD